MDSELLVEKNHDSGMESIMSSKDETPERKTVSISSSEEILLYYFSSSVGIAE
jgi:hypothetical protein